MEIVTFLFEKFFAPLLLAACSACGLLVYVPAIVGGIGAMQSQNWADLMTTPQPLSVLAALGAFFQWPWLHDVATNLADYLKNPGISAFVTWLSIVILLIGVIVYTVVRATRRVRSEYPLMLPLVAIALLAQVRRPVIPSTWIFIGATLLIGILAAATGNRRAGYSEYRSDPAPLVAIGETAAWTRHLLTDGATALTFAPSVFVLTGFVPRP